MLGLGKRRQENLEFKADPNYIANLRDVWVRDLFLKTNNNKRPKKESVQSS